LKVSDDIRAWKAALRKELLAKRLAVSDVDRMAWNAAITRHLIDGFPQLAGLTVGIYWPFQGEFDPRFALQHFRSLGTMAALPEVVKKGEPLQFRQWWPGVAMTTGAYDIPVPDGTAVVVPQASSCRRSVLTRPVSVWVMAGAFTTAPWPTSTRRH